MEVGRRGEGLGPILRRHANMNEQGANAIVEGPNAQYLGGMPT